MSIYVWIFVGLTLMILYCTRLVMRRQAPRHAEDEAYLPGPVWAGAWASGQRPEADLTALPACVSAAGGSPPARMRQTEEGPAGAGRDQLSPEVIASLRSIPPLPQALVLVLRELEEVGSSARSIAEIVSTEPVLAATLLRLCNSAAVGTSQEIVRLDQAVALLGFSTVKSVVLRLKMAELLPAARKEEGYDSERLWLHSLAVSQVAHHLAMRVKGVDPSLAATVGLLHDIGKLAANSHFPDAVAKLWEIPQRGDESFLARERRLFGADHACMGGFLASHWKLPEDLVEAIRLHHAPLDPVLETRPPELRRAILTAHVANQVAKYALVYCADMEIDIIPGAVLKALGFPSEVEKLVDDRVRGVIEKALRFAGAETCAIPPAKAA